jgi:hypothetical protein
VQVHETRAVQRRFRQALERHALAAVMVRPRLRREASDAAEAEIEPG